MAIFLNDLFVFLKSFHTYGLFPLPEVDSDSDTDTDFCTMQDFSTGSDSD